MSFELSHLGALEAEAIHVLREVASQFERPVLLFSGGKDSIVMTRLAEKAFRPGRFPCGAGHGRRRMLDRRRRHPAARRHRSPRLHRRRGRGGHRLV